MNASKQSFPRLAALAAALCILASPKPSPAAVPVVARLDGEPVGRLLAVSGGALSRTDEGVLRWRPNFGEPSHVYVRPSHPLFDRLRYYDHLQLDLRIVSGDVNGVGLSALGHVAGERQYKVHGFNLAVRTTAHGVWHTRDIDLARPVWFPWDNPDGEGAEGYFRLTALALAPDTVIELRNVRLVRSVVIVKPYYELPITWPVKTDNDDGSATYTAAYQVLNSSGRPTEITGEVLSKHAAFKVRLTPRQVAVKSGRVAKFTMTAEMSAAEIARREELYFEPLRLSFAAAHEPEANVIVQSKLVRPLSKGIKRQVVIAEEDLATLREQIRAGNQEFAKAVGYDSILAKADEFLTKELKGFCNSHAHSYHSYPGKWRAGAFMPEAVVPGTDERTVDTQIAAKTWRVYLGRRGACENVGLAYLITGDEKYATKAIELIELYARHFAEQDWYNIYRPPWHQGPAILGSSRIASNNMYGSNVVFRRQCRLMSMIADSPSWTPERREKVYRELILPYVTELLKVPGSLSNTSDITSHNVLLLGLAFGDALMVREALLRDAGAISRLSDIDADGFSSEGRPLNYHFAGMREYLPAINYLGNSGLEIPYLKRNLLEAIRMPYLRATLSGSVPSAGDCGRAQGVSSNALADHLIGIFPKEQWLFEIGRSSTMAKRIRLALANRRPKPDAWKKFISAKPHVFRHAGLAILRSGTTPQTQIMVTLDYGRSIYHGHRDRNQITLDAFGTTFTHGPGSLYNVGSGGMTRLRDKRLESFINGNSLGHNVVMVDQRQLNKAVGKLLAWSPRSDYQVAVSSVEGIYAGVTHTRGLVLAGGIVLLLDRLESDDEHVYDFAYHNFGRLSLGAGWAAEKLTAPLARTANYQNIVEPARLTGQGALRLTWDLADQAPKGKDASKARLEFWQLSRPGNEQYIGFTGMNNPNTRTIPDRTASVFRRAKGRRVHFVTVLEPRTADSRVAAVEARGDDGVTVRLKDGNQISASLIELIRTFPAK